MPWFRGRESQVAAVIIVLIIIFMMSWENLTGRKCEDASKNVFILSNSFLRSSILQDVVNYGPAPLQTRCYSIRSKIEKTTGLLLLC